MWEALHSEVLVACLGGSRVLGAQGTSLWSKVLGLRVKG